VNAAGPDSVLHLVARLSAVGVCLACLELLSLGFRLRGAAEREPGGVPQEKAARWGTGAWHAGLPTLVAARLVLGTLVLVDPGVGLPWQCYVFGLLAVSLLVCLRLPATQGADSQLTLITYSAISLRLLSGTPAAAGYCLYFLTLQLCLAYFAAGFHKLRSREWRNGSALPGILSARVFGFPALAAWLGRRRRLSWALCWGVIAWEMSFPVVLVAPREVGLFYFSCGALFHLSTAFAMGLNKFVWAFVALYPAALYCTTGSPPVAPWGRTF
jgi:hypothetical protein